MFASKDLKETEQINISSHSLMLFEERHPVSVIPPVLPRQRRLPKRIDDGAPQHVFTAVEDLYRKEYFEAIDCVKGELERRFHKDNFLFVRSIEAMLMNSANGKPFNLTQKFKDIYDKDINMERLYLQLQMLPDAIKTSTTKIKEVTNHLQCT